MKDSQGSQQNLQRNDMTDPRMEPHADKRLEEAADWLLRLQDATVEQNAQIAFRRWLEEDAQNRQAWDKLCRSWEALGHAAPMFDDAWRGAGQIRPRAPVIAPPPARRLLRRAIPLAIVACAALILALPYGSRLLLWTQADYLTQSAEIRSISLQDGSVVSLGGQSAIEVDMDGPTRQVRLLAGEAFFEVVPDPQRPFIVTARDVTARVLGTAFDVRLSADTTRIELARGSLQVTARHQAVLSPGDSVTIAHDTGQLRRDSVPAEEIATWREGMLFVNDAPIARVVEQIQRYHPGWVRLTDDALGSQRVTGLYDLREPDNALRALIRPYGGRVRHVSPWLVMLLPAQEK